MIIDEVKDFCNYICSDHFEKNSGRFTIGKLKRLIVDSKKVYLIDADLDTSILFFFRNIIIENTNTIANRQPLDMENQSFYIE